MEHSFNVELASIYGIEEAILIQNLFFWINKNVANNKNFNEERYWTYNSTKAFSELFPYLNESKIFRILKKLQDNDIIIKGNFNKEKFDRTAWYAFTDNGISILEKLGYIFYDKKYIKYSNQLKDKRWKKLANKIRKRDNYTCQLCGSHEHLQVHHKKYIKDRLAWEYDESNLITLCSECHKKVHNLN